MKRYAHYYWMVRGARFPRRIAVLDCDGCTDKPVPGTAVKGEQLTDWVLSWVTLKGGVRQRDATARGEDVSSLNLTLSQLLSSNDNTWLFASPSSRILPLIDFWPGLERGEWTLAGRDWRDGDDEPKCGDNSGDGCCIIEDPPTVIVCRRNGSPGKLVILDIRNWGIELLPHDASANERATEYLSAICDCVSALRSFGRVSLRCTAGSQAVQALRSLPECVRLHCHTHARALQLERNAYFGGRCECFRLGEIAGPVYHVDVRSMYPSLCLNLPIPISIRKYTDDPARSERLALDHPQCCCADVSLRSPVPSYPVRRRDDTVYPVGIFRAALCGPELQRAIESGAVARWHQCARYTCAPVLSTFYRAWLSLLKTHRARGSVLACAYIKRVMNALPGKFAEPGRRWVAHAPLTENGAYGQWWQTDRNGNHVRYRNVAWRTQREEVHGESYWSCPAVAAWITSAGRSRLWSYIQAAGRENVWYVDTDSLVLGQTGYDRLLCGGHIRDGEIGYLRLLGSYRRAVVYGIRHYQLDDTVSCAGVPRGSIRPGETREQYWWRIRNADEIRLGDRPTGIECQLEYPGYEEYRHGVVGPDGQVTPIEVNDGSA